MQLIGWGCYSARPFTRLKLTSASRCTRQPPVQHSCTSHLASSRLDNQFCFKTFQGVQPRHGRTKHSDRNRAPLSQTNSLGAAAFDNGTLAPDSVRADFLQSLQGLDRGIFGLKAEVRQKLLLLIQQLEASSPVGRPTEQLQVVAGKWRLLYTTVSITGVKKTKLGLREFIKLKDIFQTIDINNSTAVNEVEFAVSALGNFSGAFTIRATYEIASEKRVNVKFEDSTLTPKQLQVLFEKNYQLLLSIFNPEGWLDITYVDQTLRIGRDSKGQIFVLERA